MTSLFTALSIMAIFFAGCVQERQEGASGPTLPFSLEYEYLWKSENESSTFLAVFFEIENYSHYQFEMFATATWDEAQLVYLQNVIIKRSDGDLIDLASVSETAFTSCQHLKVEADSLEDCPAQNMRLGPTKGRFVSGLPHGTYVAYVAAMGASSAEFEIRAGFEAPPRVVQVMGGRTKLVVLQANDTGASSSGPFDESASFTAGTPFLASFRTVGEREKDPDYFAASRGNVSYSFYQSGGGLFRDGRGTSLDLAGFSGVASQWDFWAEGGNRSLKGPAATVVGILENPPFLAPNGSLPPFGEGLRRQP